MECVVMSGPVRHAKTGPESGGTAGGAWITALRVAWEVGLSPRVSHEERGLAKWRQRVRQANHLRRILIAFERGAKFECEPARWHSAVVFREIDEFGRSVDQAIGFVFAGDVERQLCDSEYAEVLLGQAARIWSGIAPTDRAKREELAAHTLRLLRGYVSFYLERFLWRRGKHRRNQFIAQNQKVLPRELVLMMSTASKNA